MSVTEREHYRLSSCAPISFCLRAICIILQPPSSISLSSSLFTCALQATRSRCERGKEEVNWINDKDGKKKVRREEKVKVRM